MIFVTVGTTEFDGLVKKIDELVGKGAIKDEVVAQIGRGKYEPKNIDWFRFEPSLDSYFRKAGVVVTHEGAGTLLELVRMGKRAVAVENPDTVTNPDILDKFSGEGYVLKCDKVGAVGEYIKKAKKKKFSKYKKPQCSIAKEIEVFLK
ncbi:PssE/Cps14G family polysaccharide biosynthesis glycosyltransferase [archaeon]